MSEGLLQVTNHRDHPTNKAYKVFFFRKKEEADYFEILIAEKNIKFEKGSEETEKGKHLSTQVPNSRSPAPGGKYW